MNSNNCLIVLAFLISGHVNAQQVPDLEYKPFIANPAYPQGMGLVVLIDEGHNNFHTREGRYSPFAKVLEQDGYIVKVHKGIFLSKSLNEGKILVIANPLNEINIDNWTLPNPSAFTDNEIKLFRRMGSERRKSFFDS